MAKRVLCDTCGVRTVAVDDDFDGTEWVACEMCFGDEEPPQPIVMADVADDDAVSAAIENRSAPEADCYGCMGTGRIVGFGCDGAERACVSGEVAL